MYPSLQTTFPTPDFSLRVWNLLGWSEFGQGVLTAEVLLAGLMWELNYLPSRNMRVRVQSLVNFVMMLI